MLFNTGHLNKWKALNASASSMPALSSLFPVSECLHGFFVLALFLNISSAFSSCLLRSWTIALGFHSIRLNNQPDGNVSGNLFLKSATCHFPEFILSLICCLNQPNWGIKYIHRLEIATFMLKSVRHIHEWFQEVESLYSKRLCILGWIFDILPTQSSVWLQEWCSKFSMIAHLHSLCVLGSSSAGCMPKQIGVLAVLIQIYVIIFKEANKKHFFQPFLFLFLF